MTCRCTCGTPCPSMTPSKKPVAKKPQPVKPTKREAEKAKQSMVNGFHGQKTDLSLPKR